MLKRSLALPQSWTPYHLSDLYTERNEAGAEGLPILSVSIHSGVSDCEFGEDELGKRVKRSEDKSLYKRCHPGDLVFNMMRAWQGAFGVVKVEGMVSPAYIVAVPNEIVYPPFMDYFMRTHEMICKINTQSYGLMDFRKRLYWDSFANIRCVLPSYAEQKKIAAILSTQDRVIELKERRLEEKRRLKKHLLKKLLYARSSCGVRLGKIVERITTRNTAGNDNVMTISAQLGLISQAQFFNKSVASENTANYYLLKKDDFAYNKSYSADYPYGAIKRLTRYKAGIVSPLYLCFRLIDPSVNIDYLEQYFEAGCMNREIYYSAQEGARSHGLLNISPDNFFDSLIYLPSLEEQSATANILSTADRELSLLRADLEQERQKKKALMQLLLSGLVRVNAKGGEADGAV